MARSFRHVKSRIKKNRKDVSSIVVKRNVAVNSAKSAVVEHFYLLFIHFFTTHISYLNTCVHGEEHKHRLRDHKPNLVNLLRGFA